MQKHTTFAAYFESFQEGNHTVQVWFSLQIIGLLSLYLIKWWYWLLSVMIGLKKNQGRKMVFLQGECTSPFQFFELLTERCRKMFKTAFKNVTHRIPPLQICSSSGGFSLHDFPGRCYFWNHGRKKRKRQQLARPKVHAGVLVKVLDGVNKRPCPQWPLLGQCWCPSQWSVAMLKWYLESLAPQSAPASIWRLPEEEVRGGGTAPRSLSSTSKTVHRTRKRRFWPSSMVLPPCLCHLSQVCPLATNILHTLMCRSCH